MFNLIDVLSSTTQNLVGLLIGIFSLSKMGSSKPDEHNVNLTINNHVPAVTSNVVKKNKFALSKKDYLLAASSLITIYIFKYINEIKDLMIQLEDEDLWCNWLNKTYRKLDDIDDKYLLQEILDEAEYKTGDRSMLKILEQLKKEMVNVKATKKKIIAIQKYLPSFFAESYNQLEDKNLRLKKLLMTILKNK
jgi:hypothetical protein